MGITGAALPGCGVAFSVQGGFGLSNPEGIVILLQELTLIKEIIFFFEDYAWIIQHFQSK